MALVIGINSYLHFEGLSVAARDAWALTGVLKERAKFTVTTVADPPSAVALRTRIDAFIAALQPGDIVVIYYAGHGIQSKGHNYLVPPDLPAEEASLERMGVPVDAVLGDIRKKSPALTVLMLDACRNNPLGGAPGLASMEAGPNTWIEFAAEAGRTAADGAFMTQLLAELPKPGLPLNDVFQNVRGNVKRQSGGKQNTLSISNMEVNFYFVPGEASSPDDALAALQRAAESLPRGDVGQTRAVEALIESGRSLAGTDLLQGLPLVKGTLDGAQLAKARMIGADLTGASLKKIDLSGANLAMTIFNRTDVTHGIIDGATLMFVDADEANFTAARAADTNWFAARAEKGTFTGANLQGAGFMFANLRGARFDGAQLEGAFFVGSDLTGASFKGATLGNTDFTGSIMDGVAMTPAQIKQACETTTDRLDPNAFARSFGVTVIESIPNQRFDGGYEHRRFLDKRYPYNLESNGLPACRNRDLKERVWYPIWESQGAEHVRNDVGMQISHKLMQQTGRRAAVRDRVEQHFEWLWKTQQAR
jgi:uncharacterized protein YjbI with pentapeptide repeats